MRHSTAGCAWEFLTEQTRVTLAEVGAHTGARMCNTMQELSERENAIKLGGSGNHLSDTTLRRQLAKTLEQKRPRHLWFSLRCGLILHTSTDSAQTSQKQTEREKRRNGLINVQLGTLISLKKVCESYV